MCEGPEVETFLETARWSERLTPSEAEAGSWRASMPRQVVCTAFSVCGSGMI